MLLVNCGYNLFIFDYNNIHNIMDKKKTNVIDEIDVLLRQTDIKTTPSTVKRIIERKLEHEKDEYRDRWKSCLGCESDRRIVTYFSQMTIIAVVISFCIYQLITLDSCPDQQAYLGLLSFVIGLVFPNPKSAN